MKTINIIHNEINCFSCLACNTSKLPVLVCVVLHLFFIPPQLTDIRNDKVSGNTLRLLPLLVIPVALCVFLQNQWSLGSTTATEMTIYSQHAIEMREHNQRIC